MPKDASASSVDLLDKDVACPGCGYNLRGLGVGEVVCPECGERNNIAELLTRTWDKPWYRAPRYNFLALPVAWLVVSLLGLLIASVVNEFRVGGYLPWAVLLAGWCVLTTLVWLLGLAWVCQKMQGVASLGYALLMHVVLVGYLGGVPLLIGGLAWMVQDIIELANRSSYDHNLLWSGLLFVAGIALFLIGRLIERLVAGYCIRLYLKQAPR